MPGLYRKGECERESFYKTLLELSLGYGKFEDTREQDYSNAMKDGIKIWFYRAEG